MSKNMELEARDLVSRLREQRSINLADLNAVRAYLDETSVLHHEVADFISRLSTAPAGDVVRLSADQIEKIIIETEPKQLTENGDRIWTRRMAEALRDLQYAAPTPSQTTEGEVCSACEGSGFTGSGDRTKECRICDGRGVKAPPAPKAGEGETVEQFAALLSTQLWRWREIEIEPRLLIDPIKCALQLQEKANG